MNGRLSKVGLIDQWIATTFSGHLSDPDVEGLSFAHPLCPAEVDPLAELPSSITQLQPMQQLQLLASVYQEGVAEGRGLLLSLGRTTDACQHMLRQHMLHKISLYSATTDAQPFAVFDTLLAAYRQRERQMSWAANKLAWPAGWLSEYLYHSALAEQRGQYMYLPEPDLQLDRELLADVKAVKHADTQLFAQRVKMINESYQDIPIFAQMSEQLDKSLSDALQSQLGDVDLCTDGVQQVYQARMNSFCSECLALQLSPSAVLAAQLSSSGAGN